MRIMIGSMPKLICESKKLKIFISSDVHTIINVDARTNEFYINIERDKILKGKAIKDRRILDENL